MTERDISMDSMRTDAVFIRTEDDIFQLHDDVDELIARAEEELNLLLADASATLLATTALLRHSGIDARQL